MAAKKQYNEQAEKTLVGLAVADAKHTIQEALRVGLCPGDFGHPGYCTLWQTILGLYTRGIEVDVNVLVSTVESEGGLRWHAETIAGLANDVLSTAANAGEYAKLIIRDSLKRKMRALGSMLAQVDDVGAAASGSIQALEQLSGRYAKAENPEVGNPADALERSECWHTRTGLKFLDSLILLTSGDLHFLAGDPSSGKTTLGIRIASYCVGEGTPIVYISAETDALEIQLSMLTMTRKISAARVNRIRYSQAARTEPAIQEISELWDEHFGDAVLNIHEVRGGPTEVISVINSISVPSVVLIDHAYAIVAQSERDGNLREHQQYNHFFAGALAATKRGNHVTVMMNQYTKAGRQGTRRDADAEYGGSGVQNIAATMTHLWLPLSDVSASGYRMVVGEVVKARAQLLVDGEGRPVDPLNMPFQFFIERKYRLVVHRLPVAGGTT